MDVPEIIPVPLAPDTQKSLTPSAVKRSHPPFHDPRKEGERPGDPRKQRKRTRKPGPADGAEHGTDAAEGDPTSDARGRRIDVRA